MTDQDAQHDETPPAHGSDDNPLDHIGEPVPDPFLEGAHVPAETSKTETSKEV